MYENLSTTYVLFITSVLHDTQTCLAECPHIHRFCTFTLFILDCACLSQEEIKNKCKLSRAYIRIYAGTANRSRVKVPEVVYTFEPPRRETLAARIDGFAGSASFSAIIPALILANSVRSKCPSVFSVRREPFVAPRNPLAASTPVESCTYDPLIAPRNFPSPKLIAILRERNWFCHRQAD